MVKRLVSVICLIIITVSLLTPPDLHVPDRVYTISQLSVIAFISAIILTSVSLDATHRIFLKS
jgi:hypothetical protein